jgi:uncharacterized protein YbaP (TraB family)
MFFFEKKNQKTFATGARNRTQAAEPNSAPNEKKFFGSFFQKRTFLLFSCFLYLPAHAEPAIWLVQGPGAKVYLFGTMHILPKNSVWFGPKIEAAFNDSQELWEEADIGLGGGQPPPDILARAVQPGGDLWAKLPPAYADKFRDQLRRCHLPANVVATYRPWFATLIPGLCDVIAQGGATLTSGTNGPEGTLLSRAKADHKQLNFFETADQQFGYMADAPEAVQMKQLREAIDDGGTDQDDFKGMESNWAAGNLPAIDKIVADTKSKDPEFYATLFTQRNIRFAEKLLPLLHGTRTIFVAIGAAHLAGPDSVQAQLVQHGFTAKRL